MDCPVCNDVKLAMSDRQGIEIDYCPQCRGVWLDRGELDKLIERASAELAPPAPPVATRPPPLEQPFFLRLFGLGNIVMQTSDRSHPSVRLRAIRDGEQLYERIRAAVEESRARKGVRELDVE